VVKSLWASVQGNPRFMQRVNGWLAVFFMVLIPPAYYFGWLTSITFVSALSLWALVSGHWSAWQAARVEVKQELAEKALAEEDIPGAVVQRIVQETEVSPASDRDA